MGRGSAAGGTAETETGPFQARPRRAPNVKHLKHPATIIAAVALFVALGGGAVAYAAGVINGSQIKNHSIATKKLTKKAIKQLHGAKGATGAPGTPGAAGAPGATGPQGPGGKIINYNATAVVGTPTPTALGTVLGDTLGATCTSTSGNAKLTVYILTSDGSWTVDYTYLAYDQASPPGSVFVNRIPIPAGTITTSSPIDFTTAASGGDEADTQISFIQTTPSPGSMIWHETAITTSTPSASCHMTVEYFPETVTAVAGTRHAATKTISHLPHSLGRR
jgi:type II secretory pathway pseudopilin PulG